MGEEFGADACCWRTQGPGGNHRYRERCDGHLAGLPFEAAAFKIENEAQRFIRKTEDAREGPRAFIEKRKPNYKGK